MPPINRIPTDAELSAYAAGQLTDDQSAWVESYLESAPDAEDRWAAISIDDPLLSQIPDRISSDTEPSATSTGSTLSEGSVVGRYTIRRLLGRGGMGAVYRAHDPVIDREVALKILPGDSDIANERALAEAQAQGRVNHPNIVTVYDAVKTQDGVFIAMELMSGCVEDLLTETGPLSVEKAVSYLLSASRGLQAAHQVGLIHRDIKPANLLMSSEGTVKIGDFGLARTIGSETVSGHAPLAGTPHFMSPEQCRSEKVDVRSDVYALGATLYMLLTGLKPYCEAESALQVLFAHCQSPPPDPCATRSELPPICTKVVQRAMAKRRDDRFASVSEFADSLKSLVIGEESSSNSSDTSGIWRKLSDLPTGPSLAVLPLDNLSQDPEQEYFCDGITEEIISALARFQDLRVIARNSTFQFKGQSIDVRSVGAELGADFVLEGSIRRSGQRIRVNAQLIDADSGGHVWTESYNRDLSTTDLFDIQDDIAQRVAAAVGHPSGAAFQTQRQAVLAKDTEILEAYELVLRWHEYLRKPDWQTHIALRDGLEQTTQNGSELGDAWAALSFLYLDEVRGGVKDGTSDAVLSRAQKTAARAVTLEPNSVTGNWALFCIHFHQQEFEEFRTFGRRALMLNPNHPDILADYALCVCFLGEWERGVALTEKAISLSPGNPAWYHAVPMLNHLRLGNNEQALAEARQCIIEGWFWSPLFLAVCHGLLGNTEPAQSAISKLLELHPEFHRHWQEEFRIWHVPEEIADPLLRGLRLAGLSLAST